MNVPELLDDVETRLVRTLRLSRLKNKIVGTGYITGLRALSTILNIPKPTVFMSKGASIRLCESVSQFGLEKALIVTDEMLYKLGVLDGILAELDKQGMQYSLFTEVLPDPTFQVVDAGLRRYQQDSCDCVMAIGGGSSIDAAKVIALAATNEVEPIGLVGILKGKKPAAPFFAIPTTSGTGSEATIGAVISDADSHKKELVIDTKVVPLLAALDPELMKGLPAHITAATGIDALTHLIEAYLSGLATKESDYYARSGIQMIFENLPQACKRGTVIRAREKMALASYYGGLTINIAGLGYVHAFAHQLGALYQIPHGESNAKVLPQVLEFNKLCCQERMAELARMLKLGREGDSDSELASVFIEAVQKLIADVGIEPTVEKLARKDFNTIIAAAFKEANTTYAVPKYMSYDEAEQLLMALAATGMNLPK
ncbi:iron-containing alcohol dehydrogenase [Oleiphilus messinensis]|uniref:Iron-containing alcohol dehydrogenase n=1 Tax=Oleiphilus messinensis TaxID=141451 RepID=A0A1Y0I961_9GAMM|nr:iron-containing alcohol dehydrogenase [Oleiphilus messinensis]ARU56719.1 iron-containing alcohol dehydrogenase [Oleiphilus messinensis]